VQVGVVEGEGAVGGVEGDEGRDNVGIGVWLDVEDLKEDVEGGGGVADGPDLGGASASCSEVVGGGSSRSRQNTACAEVKKGG